MPKLETWTIDNTEYTLGVVPKPTASDAGKIPRVNAQGEFELMTIQPAESASFGGGS